MLTKWVCEPVVLIHVLLKYLLVLWMIITVILQHVSFPIFPPPLFLFLRFMISASFIYIFWSTPCWGAPLSFHLPLYNTWHIVLWWISTTNAQISLDVLHRIIHSQSKDFINITEASNKRRLWNPLIVVLKYLFIKMIFFNYKLDFFFSLIPITISPINISNPS